jgi:hypothetical protein
MNCSDVALIAPDLVLGMLSGDERAEALAHVDSCRQCRDIVDKLSASVDAMSLLAPQADPASGFEERVLARIEFEGRRRSRRAPSWMVAAAAAVVVIGALFAAGALWLRQGSSSNDQIAAYTMRTPNGRTVGEAYVHKGDSTWVFVDVPGWTDDDSNAGDYALRVTTDDGESIVLPGNFAGGQGGWGTRVSVDPDDVRELALVDSSGRVWCAATVSA